MFMKSEGQVCFVGVSGEMIKGGIRWLLLLDAQTILFKLLHYSTRCIQNCANKCSRNQIQKMKKSFLLLLDRLCFYCLSLSTLFQILFQSKVPSIFEGIPIYLHTFGHIFPFFVKIPINNCIGPLNVNLQKTPPLCHHLVRYPTVTEQ